MLIGLQGSGKTTTTAKHQAPHGAAGAKVLMASWTLGARRLAAAAVLGEQVNVATLPIVSGEPLAIAPSDADGRFEGYDVVLLVRRPPVIDED